jgi:hypothetical protein
MKEFYSENLNPKNSTIQQLLMFSKSLKIVKSIVIDEKIVLNLN